VGALWQAPARPRVYFDVRILAFCDYFAEPSSGGAERVALEVYRRLAEQGATIRVITTMPRSMQPVRSSERLQVRVIPSLELARPLGIQASLAPRLFLKLRTLAGGFRPDVLHANTLFFQTSLAAALVHRTTGIPLATSVQIAGLQLMPQPGRFLGTAYERTAGRFVLSQSARVIAPGPSVRDHLVRLGTPPGRIALVPNGVDLRRFWPRHELAQNDPPVIMFLARLIVNKGPDTLLSALLQLKQEGVNFKAIIIGDGPLRPQLEQRAQPLGAAVTFLGQQPDVAPHLRQADLLIRPSLTEGMPLGILDAMASRVCVIASDIDGNRDLVVHDRNGILVPAEDSQRLADAIREMLRNPARRAQLARAGYETAQAYGWDAIVARTSDVFSSMIPSAPQEKQRAA
jgi:glycosyltransferase involved in cell wall biosynthesis